MKDKKMLEVSIRFWQNGLDAHRVYSSGYVYLPAQNGNPALQEMFNNMWDIETAIDTIFAKSKVGVVPKKPNKKSL